MSPSHSIYHRECTTGAKAAEPPCGTLEERFDWSDAIEDVTCDGCREALERETKTGHSFAGQRRRGRALMAALQQHLSSRTR